MAKALRITDFKARVAAYNERHSNISGDSTSYGGTTYGSITDKTFTVGSSYTIMQYDQTKFYHTASFEPLNIDAQHLLKNCSFTAFELKLTFNNTNAVKLSILKNPNINVTDETAYKTAFNSELYKMLSGNTVYTISVSDPQVIRNILTYGIALSWVTFNIQNYVSTISIDVQYVDNTEPPSVNITYPSMETVIGTQSNTFRWEYSQSASALQTHYDLQYSTDERYTWTDIAAKAASSNNYAAIPANTLPSGIVSWRVRAYMSGGQIVSEWSETQIIVRANPSTSTVTCDGKPRPTVSWTSAAQAAYQVRFGDIDSGAVFGTAKSYKLPYYFSDRVYSVSVRTQTTSGTWSDWSDNIYITIANTAQTGEVLLISRQNACATVLEWFVTGTFDYYIVYRDDTPICKTTALTYTDDAANGSHKYYIRAVAQNEYYLQSNTITSVLKLSCDVIKPIDGDWIRLKYTPSAASRSYDRSTDISYKYFAGRTKPVSITQNHSTLTVAFTCAFQKSEQAEHILSLVGKTVIYKDKNGGMIIGTLNDAGYDSEMIFTVSFRITETDYNEVVRL